MCGQVARIRTTRAAAPSAGLSPIARKSRKSRVDVRQRRDGITLSAHQESSVPERNTLECDDWLGSAEELSYRLGMHRIGCAIFGPDAG